MQTLERLKSEGKVALDIDIRKNSLLDQSGNGNHAVGEGGTYVNTRLGRGYLAGCNNTNKLIVSDSASLRATDVTVFIFGEFEQQNIFSRIISKRDAGGTQYEIRISSASISVYDGSTTSTAEVSIIGKNLIAVKIPTSGIPQLYLDGIYIMDFDSSVSITENDADLNLSNYYASDYSFNNPVTKYTIANESSLTDQQIHDIYFEYMNSRGVLEKPRRNFVYPTPEETDTTCVVHYDGYTRTGDGKLADISGNGNHGTIEGNFVTSKGLFSLAGRGNGVSTAVTAAGTAAAFTADGTLSIWLRDINTSSTRFPLNLYASANDAWGILLSVGSIAIYDDIDNAGQTRYATAIAAGVWHHIVAVQDGLDNKLYINGNLVGSGSSSSGNLGSFSTALKAWYRGSAGYIDADMCNIKVFTQAKDQAWITQEYKKGAKLLRFQDDLTDSPPTLATVTEGKIGFSEFEVLSNNYKKSEDADGQKWIEVVSGQAVAEAQQLTQPYGTYVFKAVRGSGDTIRVRFIHDDSLNDGYYYYDTGSTAGILRTNGGGTIFSLSDQMDDDVEYTFAITRDYAGTFIVYRKQAGQAWTQMGTGTNNTITTGNTIQLYSFPGVKFRLLGVHEGKLELSDIIRLYP